MSKTVFITGASSGLGRALAHAYARQGFILGLLGRRQDSLQQLAEELGTTSHIYVADVCDRQAVHEAATDFLQRTQGRIDIVIASAGISVGVLTQELSDYEVAERVMQTNVMGMWATFEAFVPAMRNQVFGTLVGIASVAGIRGLPGAGAYSASKAAVIAYCESLRLELHEYGVRVVTISPGYIRTAMTAKNPYSMPFLLPADEFAKRAQRHIESGKSYVVIPWPMGIVGKLMRLLPNCVYDRLARGAPRKPRQYPQK